MAKGKKKREEYLVSLKGIEPLACGHKPSPYPILYNL
jgi:hypothetical protein